LDEQEVVASKVKQASKFFNGPFILDEEGFYIEGFKAFPGTLSRFVIEGMGWQALLKLAAGKEINAFCDLAFLDSAGEVHIFAQSVKGSLRVDDDHKLVKSGTISDYFIPAGQKLTLTQMESIPEFQGLFPRHRAIEEMVRSKAFEQEILQLDKMGVQLKDLDQGLVDFFTTYEDRLVYLCWKEGEDQIRFWHDLEAGFAGRRPIEELER